MRKNWFRDTELNLQDTNDSEKESMYFLRDNCLNPIREQFGKIKVTSGYRSIEHNKKVDGSIKSHHLCRNGFSACDIVPLENTLDFVFNWVKNNLNYAELILEHDQQCIHISTNIDSNLNTKRTLERKTVNDKKVYF